MKKVFISGITGQDGAWLAKLLLSKGYKIYGGVRDKDSFIDWRLKQLGILESIEFIQINLLDSSSVENCIRELRPDEFYNLAAQSSVAESFHSPLETSLVDGLGVLYILESIQKHSPITKFFQAGSSEIFGNAQESPQTEETPIKPSSPYAIAKAYAHWMNINYRKVFGLFCVNGILFGHESELRGKEFFSRKVSLHVANWYHGNRQILEVGNIDIEKDWGYAEEFVLGMYLSLQLDKPEDFIFATGTKTKVKNFIDSAYGEISVSLQWEGEGDNQKAYDKKTGELLVKINPKFYRPIEVKTACGNPQKAKEILKWEPKIYYHKIAELMVRSDIQNLNK